MIITDLTGAVLAIWFILIFILRTIFAAIYTDMFSEKSNNINIIDDVITDLFSIKGFLNFGVGFCSYWAMFGLTEWWSFDFAIAVGVIIAILLGIIYYTCLKLIEENISETPDDLVFRSGTVHSTSSRAVTLQITFNGYNNKFVVLPDEGYNTDDFKTGDIAFISRIETPNENSIRFYAKPYSANTDIISTK